MGFMLLSFLFTYVFKFDGLALAINFTFVCLVSQLIGLTFCNVYACNVSLEIYLLQWIGLANHLQLVIQFSFTLMWICSSWREWRVGNCKLSNSDTFSFCMVQTKLCFYFHLYILFRMWSLSYLKFLVLHFF